RIRSPWFTVVHFQIFRLHPPHAPLLRRCFRFRADLAPDSLFQLSAVLRTSLIARSLVSRIRPYRVCVAGVMSPTVLRTICSLPVALQSRCRDAVTFSFLAGSTAREGLPPSGARWLPSARVPAKAGGPVTFSTSLK